MRAGKAPRPAGGRPAVLTARAGCRVAGVRRSRRRRWPRRPAGWRRARLRGRAWTRPTWPGRWRRPGRRSSTGRWSSAATREELAAGLAAVAAGRAVRGAWCRDRCRRAESGAGGVRVSRVRAGSGRGWAAELAAASPVFAARLAECSAALAPLTWTGGVQDVLAGAAGRPGPGPGRRGAAGAVGGDGVPGRGVAGGRGGPGRGGGALAGRDRRRGGGRDLAAGGRREGRGAAAAGAGRAGRAGRHGLGRRARRPGPRADRGLGGAAVGRGGERPGRDRGLAATRARSRSWRRPARRPGSGRGCCRWTTPRTARRSRQLQQQILAALDGIAPGPARDPDDLGDDRGVAGRTGSWARGTGTTACGPPVEFERAVRAWPPTGTGCSSRCPRTRC